MALAWTSAHTRIAAFSGGNVCVAGATFVSGGIDSRDLTNFALQLVVTVSFILCEKMAGERINPFAPPDHVMSEPAALPQRSRKGYSIAIFSLLLFILVLLNIFGAQVSGSLDFLRSENLVAVSPDQATHIGVAMGGAAITVFGLPFLLLGCYLLGLQNGYPKFLQAMAACAAALLVTLLINQTINGGGLSFQEKIRVLVLRLPEGTHLTQVQMMLAIVVLLGTILAVMALLSGVILIAASIGAASAQMGDMAKRWSRGGSNKN